MQTGKRSGRSMIVKVSVVMIATLLSLMINVIKPYAGFELSLDGDSPGREKSMLQM